MQMEVVSENDLLLVTTHGRITYEQMLAESDPLANRAGADVYARKVLVDLSDLEYIDTSGISWLLACHKRTREARGMLVLHSVPPLVGQMLRVLHLDRVFLITDDLTAAQQRVAAAPPPAADEPDLEEPNDYRPVRTPK